MRSPDAGLAACLLLRGEGKRRTQASPAGSASFLRAQVLHSTPERMYARSRDARRYPRPRSGRPRARATGPRGGLVHEAERLEDAYDQETKVLALTVPEREAILRALDDSPDGPAELRAVLLDQQVWRRREGLA
jgi:hypothetical protein